MKLHCVLCAAAVLALAAPRAEAQKSAADVFKDKVAEGLYEVKSDIDLTGVPGVPRDKQKATETRSRCVTRQEIDQGVAAGADCSVTKYSESPGVASIVMVCKDGKSSDMKYTFSPDGFTSEITTTGKEAGAKFVSVFRSTAKRVGPCLGAGSPGKAPAPK